MSSCTSCWRPCSRAAPSYQSPGPTGSGRTRCWARGRCAATSSTSSRRGSRGIHDTGSLDRSMAPSLPPWAEAKTCRGGRPLAARAAEWRWKSRTENPGPSAYMRRVAVQLFLGEERRLTFLSMDNEVCLAWLADALRQLRQEGRTKAVGYLEAVLEEVVFEMKMCSKSEPTARKASRFCH